MLAVRNVSVGTIELPNAGSAITASTHTSQDNTLAELFQRLELGGTISVIARPARAESSCATGQKAAAICYWPDYAPADLLTLEYELSQELSLVLAKLQR